MIKFWTYNADMEYLEELYDRRLRERSDEGIAHEKYALAVGAAPELLEFLRKSIHTKVEKFKELFPGERIELRQPGYGRIDYSG